MKLSICVDMGAKNNGVFIAKTDGKDIVDKKAFTVVIDKKSINFSKKSRRENRHRVRNDDRHDLARKLFLEVVNINDIIVKEKKNQWNENQVIGLLKNRGFDRFEGAFEELHKLTQELLKNYTSLSNQDIVNIQNSEKLINFINSFGIDKKKQLEEKLSLFITEIENIYTNLKIYKNKNNILSDIQAIRDEKFSKFSTNTEEYFKNLLNKYNISYKTKRGELKKQLSNQELDLSKVDFDLEIENINKLDLDDKFIENFEIIETDFKFNEKDKENDISLLGTLKYTLEGIKSGAKPRVMYLQEIKQIIDKFDFLQNIDKKELFNVVGNISNLQLRVLRKYFNGKNNNKFDDKKLSIVLYRYFLSRHYNKGNEKRSEKELFKVLKEYIQPKKDKNFLEKDRKHYNYYSDDGLYKAKKFLKNCNPELTIPPYEDMNNRGTYKCNSLLINPNAINDNLKEAINILEKNEKFKKLNIENIKEYNKKLQRILDISSRIIQEDYYPRAIFSKEKTNKTFYQNLLGSYFDEFNKFATKYYKLEEKAINGIFDKEDKNNIFIKCNKNTPARNNIKDTLINNIWNTNFTKDEVDILKETIKNQKIKDKKLTTVLENISDTAKKYQNSFFKDINEAYHLKSKDKRKYINETPKDLKYILDLSDDILELFKDTLKEQKSCFINNDFDIAKEKTTKKGITLYPNLKRFINSLRQTYDILFVDIHGHNKTCINCTIENNIRSNEDEPTAKRLLSDVAKPINGKLDMMLDRVAWEVVKQINSLDEINNIEILLEQNKFNFEENLKVIGIRKKAPKDEELEYDICPYTGKKITNIEYDHIISQSSSRNQNKQIYNSEANLILCSKEGNQEKGDKDYNFDNLKESHLKVVFGKSNKEEIKQDIRDTWQNSEGLKKQNYINFKNLSFKEKLAFRYALFMIGEEVYNKALELLQTEQKTITNGTQKRFAKLIFEKLQKKFKKQIDCDVKVTDNKLVSATRLELAEYYLKYDKTTGEIIDDKNITKQTYQNDFSHIVDAMVVYYLSNNLNMNDFVNLIDGVDKEKSKIEVKTNQWHETINPKYNIASKRLFDQNDIGVGYIQLKEIKTTNEKGKNLYIYQKGIVKNSFVDSKFTKKNFDYFMQNGILEKIEVKRNKQIEILYQVNKNKLYGMLFNDKVEVLNNYSHYVKLTKELQYTYTKTDPFDFLDKFLEPKTIDDKNAVKKIIKKDIPTLDNITFDNLMTWFSRSNKLDKNGAKLGYYKSWEIFTDTLIKNKDTLFKEVEKEREDKKTKEKIKYTVVTIDKDKALEECKKTIFKQVIPKKRKVKKSYTLYTASKNDTQYIHRRKDNKGNYIYQTRIAHRQYKEKHFFKSKLFVLRNIIPLKMDNYKKAFQ